MFHFPNGYGVYESALRQSLPACLPAVYRSCVVADWLYNLRRSLWRSRFPILCPPPFLDWQTEYDWPFQSSGPEPDNIL